MNSSNVLLLQSALIFLQIVNAAVGNEIQWPGGCQVVFAAFVGAFQFYVNSIGNKLDPKKEI